MMLTIHGLPMIVKYQDVKALIREKCNITDYILDNLVSEGDGTKKVRIGLADEREGTYFIKCLDGFRFGSNILRIVPFGKPQPSNPQQNFEQPGGGYTPRSDYPNQSSYGQTGRPMGGPDMMRQDPPRQDSWGPGNSQWGPSQHQGPSQVGQPPMQQNTFNNYQQGMNAPYGQEHTPQGNIRQPYDQRDQFHGQSRTPQIQGYGHPKNDIPSHGAPRPHVLRSVEIVNEPLNRPITQSRYQTYETPQKPITIMKDNFQGPQCNLDRQPGQSYAGQGPHGPPQGHHGPGHAGPHTTPTHQASGPWAQPNQQDKPPFSKPSPNFDRKYPEADKRPMMAKTLNEPPRNDYNAKPGPRFSPRRDIPDSHGKPGPRFSPRRDIIDPHSKPGPRFSPRRDIDPHSKPGLRFSPRRDIDPHSKPGLRFSPRRDIDPHSKPGPRFSPRRDIDSHSKPGPRFSPRRDVPDKPGPRFSPRRDVSDLHRRMPSPGRRMPSPGRRMPSPGRRMSSPGRRMPSPGRRMPSPGRRMPSPGHRISPGRRMPSPGKGRGRPITPPHKRHNSPGRYSPRRIDKPSDKFGSDGRPLKDVRPAYDPPAQAPNQAMFSGGYRPSLHENVQYPIPGARPMEPRPSTWQERDKAFPPGGKKEDDRRMPKFEPRIDAELKGRSPPRKSRSPIRRDRSPPRDRFKKHSPSPRSPRRSWALEKRRSPEAREAPPPPMWPGQPQEEPFRRYPDRPEEEKKRMPVWEPRRPEDERSFENPLRVRSDLISRPPEPSSRSYKPDDRIPPRESRFEPREPKFESRDPKFDSRFEPREDFRRADDMLRRFDRDVREPHRPIDDVRRRDEFTREDYPRREEERKIPTKADKFPETFDKEIEDVYQRAQALKKRSEELRKRDLERRREELERDARKPEFDSKFDRRDDRPPESGYAKDKRVAAAAHDIAHKAKRDKAIDEISTKITDKHGSHFTGEMRTRVLEEMRIVVGKAMQDMFGYKDVSFIEMVVKFNAKYDQNAELRMYNDVLSSLPSMYRNMHANKRPANDSRASEIPSKSARHDHEMGLNRERPISRPLKYENKLRAEPLEQRKAVHSRLVARDKEDAKKRPATREDVKAKKPKLSKELAKKIADAQMPASDGYELNQAMSKALETELQDIIIKAWQELPDVPPTEAEAIVTDKFRNEAGDDLRNALGLNVTKRILNVANPFNVKIEFDTQPFGPCAKNFLRWLNCETMRRTLDGQHNYCAVLPTQADFDRVVSKPTVRIGTLKAKIKPHYRFTKCPPKLKTSYKCSKRKMPEQEIKKVITDLNNKLDASETEDKKTTHPLKAEVKKEVKKPAEVKSEAKKLTEVKTEAKKTTVVKSEAKKTTEVKIEANKPTEVKTEANKPTETEAKKPAEVKTDTKKPMNEPKKKTEVKTPTELKTAKKSPPKKVEATVKTEAKPVVTPKPTDSKTNVTKVTAKKSQATPKKEAVTKTTTPIKSKDTKTVTKVNEKAKTTTKKTTANKTIPNKVDNKKKQRKQSDFDELDDEDILALMSNAIVLDECAGSDED